MIRHSRALFYLAVCLSSVSNVDAATSATVITGISPTGATQGVATSITFTGTIAAGDKAVFASTCAGATTAALSTTGTNVANDFTVSGAPGTYKLCYTSNGETDSIEQTGITLTTVAATSATVITAISVTTATAGTAVSITLTGTAASGDKVTWAASCTGATPDTAVTAGTNQATSFTISATGSLKLCYRSAGGSDSVEQTGISITVSGGAAGSDPIARWGDTVREFSIPPHVLTPLLHAPDMSIYGSTFEGGGSWEQWFGRLVLKTPEDLWIDISIKPNLLEFNHSRARRDAFQTFDVLVGQGDIEQPSAIKVIEGFDTKASLNMLGWNIAFRGLKRQAPVRQTSFGGLRRECVDIGGVSLHLYICTSPADEYHGLQRHLSIQYAHLDLAVIEIKDVKEVTGLLPELWGIQPMSESSSKYIVEKDASAKSEQTETLNLPKKVGWAGGIGMEDLQKDCLEDNETVLTV
eukprot:TRINITY_DN67644_c0_g1_i1.p1 TRINITY_DN67644_c0_g1~~TRINITY_DN67644_c0_g1_i1.p1  ORF type:complete len:468 (+),score=80.78 TRINITY_DN67644_c0_g1_i1:58-1461(+)